MKYGYVTGHSLGGSMASLGASYILGEKLATKEKTKLVTFGQPRTGNEAFKIAHEMQSDYVFRVTHWRDMVPHIPNVGYYHHRAELKFVEVRTYPYYFLLLAHGTRCEHTLFSAGEDKGCSKGLWVTASIHDHTHYYNKQVSEYGINGCI
ncbi:unnamed protein product [Strongylus vulgaris]|uniref:Fungal lipase-type domain-containing protein n=1 Tax=Strongylus vulgaris TaxID=40348 RepID=A0A3P7IRR6_STRVU|nr:unnamed protein product [Strongylus vulgaris]